MIDIYFHGNYKRLLYYIGSVKCEKLKPKNLVKALKGRAIFFSRAWSPLISFFLLFKKRCFIIQVADGLVTSINCKKKINSKPQPLYQKIYADLLVVRQPLWSVSKYVEVERTKALVDFNIKKERKRYDRFVLVFGNDPFIGLAPESVAQSLRGIFLLLDGCDFYVSCSKNQEAFVLDSVRGKKLDNKIRFIGKYGCWKEKNNKDLLIGTPSTVLYDHALVGGGALVIEDYECPSISSLFMSFCDGDVSKVKNGIVASTFKYCDVEEKKIDFLFLGLNKKTFFYKDVFRVSLIGIKRFLGDLNDFFCK